ncbi:MAG: hypothetical protein IKC07_01235 [Clostridia bacterium]|nr:hypothetical protein [Clostridia bacterium]
MTNAIKSKTLRDKMNALCEYALKEVNLVCDISGVTDQERTILENYVKGFLTFSKRCSPADLPLIEGITKNASFRHFLANSIGLYPFLEWIRWDLSMTAYIYAELQKAPILEEDSPIWKVFLSSNLAVSYSSATALFDYIKEFRPSEEVIASIAVERPFIRESTGEELTILHYPALHFYYKVDTWEGGIKTTAQKKDFSEFSRVVMLCAPEEKPGLLSLECAGVTDEDREEIINAAELFAIRYRADYPDKNFYLPERTKPHYSTHTKVNYDTFSTFSKASLIQAGESGDFYPIEVVNYITQKDNEEKERKGEQVKKPLEMELNGESKAVAAMILLAAGRHNLTPKDTRGTTFETTFYKLYKLVSKDSEPHTEDMLSFISGILALSRPRVAVVKGSDEKGKAAERRQQVTLLHLLGNTDLENILYHIEEKNKGKQKDEKDATLFNQQIKFALDDVWFIGFRNTIVEDKDGEKKPVFFPTERKKALLLPNSILENGMTNKELVFLSNIKPKGTKTKKGHMAEADLLSAVFGYDRKLLLAREKDKRKEPLINPKTGERFSAKLQTWEDYTLWEISHNKSNNKKKLKSLFEKAIKDGIIVSYSFKPKTKVYEWVLVMKEEEKDN